MPVNQAKIWIFQNLTINKEIKEKKSYKKKIHKKKRILLYLFDEND